MFSEDLRRVWTCNPSVGSWVVDDVYGDVPPARQGGAMVYDCQSQHILLFGGLAGGQSQALSRDRSILSDTWSFDPMTKRWQEMKPSGDVPETGPIVSMVYDSTLCQAILFSAEIDRTAPVRCDTWVYDCGVNEWNAVGRLHGPSSRLQGYSVVYVPGIEEVLLFGGASLDPLGGDSTSEIWAYQPTTASWTELHPEGESPPRAA